MNHGLKSLAKELHKHGRYGDSIVAHINPQEAAMLKAMGGSGTINPTTGLPEYWSIGNVFKPVTQAVKSVQQAVGQANPFNPGSTAGKAIAQVPGVSALQNAATQIAQPIEKAVVQPASAGLASVDKAIGKVVPGGWGTLGMVAASMIPGMQPLAMAGLGALNGSGMLKKGGSFNLQGAIMGGAMAYGMSSLSNGLQTAGSSIPGADITAANMSPDAISMLNNSQGWTGAAAQEAAANAVAQGAASAGADAAGAGFSYTPSGEMVPSNISPDITGAVPNVASSVAPEAASSGIMNTLKEYGQGTLNNAAAAGRGIANLTGLGPEGLAGIAPAASAFGATGATLQNTAVPIAFGGMGLAELDAQAQYLKDQQASGTIDNTEYNTQMALIDSARTKATEAMNANPYMFGSKTASPTGAPITAEDAIKQNPYMFAMGGAIESGGADSYSVGDSDDNYAMGGVPGYALGGMAGGRFLSGNGDGVSDDIPAVIGDSQPAKLADGEFVIPARVVSELGNGSSKAGAKQLYAMMDRVQKARGTTVGKGKFAKDSNSEKYLPA
jgi:hypothetical protein